MQAAVLEAVSLGRVAIQVSEHSETLKTRKFNALFATAIEYLRRLATLIGDAQLTQRSALIGRIRGTGPGASFGALVEDLEQQHPFQMRSPFEGCETVAGGVLEARHVLDPERDDALLKLRFDAGSLDLPLHVHEQSDRFIYVLSGRGFFHVSDQAHSEFDASDIRHTPVRERDVLLFNRGVVHTFSAPDQPLVLLSYHAPYIPLDDPRQYTLPARRICPMRDLEIERGQVACDPAWTVLAAG